MLKNIYFAAIFFAVLCFSGKFVFAEETAAAESTEATDSKEATESTEDVQASMLLESVLNGDIDGIERALEAGEDIDLVNTNGWSAAMFAVASGDIYLLQHLIELNIDLNNADHDGMTPLMKAALAVRIAWRSCFQLFLSDVY